MVPTVAVFASVASCLLCALAVHLVCTQGASGPPSKRTYYVKVPLLLLAAAIGLSVAALKLRVKEPVAPCAPIGSVVAYLAESIDSLPEGWRVCDGQELSFGDFPELAVVLAADPTVPLFSLPNLQGVFLRGVDRGEQWDPTGGERAIGFDVQEDQHVLERHRHELELGIGASGSKREMVPLMHGLSDPRVIESSEAGTRSTDSHGGARELETRPVNVAVSWIIRVK